MKNTGRSLKLKTECENWDVELSRRKLLVKGDSDIEIALKTSLKKLYRKISDQFEQFNFNQPKYLFGIAFETFEH